MLRQGDTVVLDACVLYPAPLRDLLLSLATAGLYRPRWTHTIQQEWMTSLLKHRPDIQPQALAHTAALMNRAIPDSLVENFEHLVDTLPLPDLNDRHVLAAAITAKANAIVTFNIKDFTQAHIQVCHPDDFCVLLCQLDEAISLSAIRQLRQRLKNPPRSAQQLLSTFERQRLPRTSRLLAGKLELI